MAVIQQHVSQLFLAYEIGKVHTYKIFRSAYHEFTNKHISSTRANKEPKKAHFEVLRISICVAMEVIQKESFIVEKLMLFAIC